MSERHKLSFSHVGVFVHDLPKMVDLYLAGKIKVDEMLTRSYPIDQINEAYQALEKGENARAILTFE